MATSQALLLSAKRLIAAAIAADEALRIVGYAAAPPVEAVEGAKTAVLKAFNAAFMALELLEEVYAVPTT